MALLSSPAQLIASVPPVTRAFTAATVASSLLYFWLHWKSYDLTPYLTLIPGSSLFYPWTFVTSGLVETTVPELIISLVTVPPSLRYLERIWGTVETIKFIVVCIAIPNVISFAFNWLEYVATRNADLFLYGMEYHGQMALQTSILVAFTQLIPEHQIQVMGVLKARVKSLPMAYLTFSTVMTILGFQCPFIIIQFGWFVSWIYLRFYKKNSGDVIGGTNTYGDTSAAFALVTWFPPIVHYPISFLANNVHALATRYHLIPHQNQEFEPAGYSQVPGGARAEAERRRAMALKALDQRMAGTPSTSQPPNGYPQPPASAVPRPEASVAPPAPKPSERKNSVDLGEGMVEP